MNGVTLRPATEADLPAINDIYNYYVRTSTCTYQEEPDTLATRMSWFTGRGPEHPVIVAELNGQVVGWGALSRFHARTAYRNTVEDAVYVARPHHHRGIGRQILTDLVDRAKAIGHHSIVALVSAEQTGSIDLHKRLGFTEVGRLREVGRKFDQWLDVAYLQLAQVNATAKTDEGAAGR